MKETRDIVKNSTAEKVELEKPFEPHIPIGNGNGNYPAYRGYDQETSQLIEYWRAIRKRLWLVIGVAVLMTTLVAIYMARRPNVYQAQATVQVDLELANQDLVDSSRRSPISNDPTYFNTQLQLLTSESLLRRVVKELSLDSSKDFQKDKKQSSGSTFSSMLKAIGLANDAPVKDDSGVQEATIADDIGIASAEKMEEAKRLAPYVDILRKNLTVEPVRESRQTFKETRLIEIFYRHTDPKLAALIVNGIGTVFTKQNDEKRTGKNRDTNEYLTDRIAELQSEIRAGELKLFNETKNAGIIETNAEQTIVIDRLSGLQRQLLDAEEARKSAQAEYNAVSGSPERIKARVEQEVGRYTTERENSIRDLINENKKDIAKLKAERNKLSVEYKDGAPEIREIDRQVAALEEAISKAADVNQNDLEEFRNRQAKILVDGLRTKYIAAKSKEEALRSDYNQQYNQAQGQNQAAVTIGLLKQDIDTKKGFLENLRKQQDSNDVVATGTNNNISFVEIAIPPDAPVSPSRTSAVLAALMLSTLFGMGLALFLEYLDDTIRTTEDVESFLGVPALAAIPTIDSLPKKRKLLLVGANGEPVEKTSNAGSLLIHNDARSSLAEAYRHLRTSILLSTAGHAPRSLLITSSLPAEGKTTTAVNTAISLAQTGAKVLVIDADMRRPRLHNIFNTSNAAGLSTILSSDMKEDEILNVVQYDEDSKLHLISSGPVPPNPAELIGSEQMTRLMKYLQEEFTHVIVDSPPIASFTDGVLIASMVNGVILVVHSGKSSRQVVKRSRQLLQDIGAKVFGVVLNNVNLKAQDNYYYYQSYYYRDQYRQDQDDAE